MLNTKTTLVGFGYLIGFVGLLVACGVSQREQALEATVVALQQIW